MSFDTIIKNGTVVDGSGLPKRVADVGIRDGIVTDIGRLSGARRTIDAVPTGRTRRTVCAVCAVCAR